MTSRTRHPLSLPPPPQPKPLATPPTSPEMSPAAFGTFPRHYQPQPQPQPGTVLQPKISPSKRILRRKKSGLGSTIRTKKSSKEPFPSPLPEGKENQDDKSGLRRKRSTGVEEREKERTGRFASRLRSVRSVPLLNSRTDKDKEKDNENVGTRDLFGGRATMRNMDRRDSGKVMEMTMGESEVLSEESHVGRYGLKSMMNLEDSHPLARYPTSQASASSTNMVEFGYLPSSAELDGGFGSISSRGGGADRKDPAGWQYSSISTGTASNFASLSSSSKGQGKGFSRERSETVTTFGGATSTSGSGSPRSMTTTIRIDLRDETTPRAWTGRRRSSEASEIGQVFGMTPGTGSTVRAAGLGIETNKEDVYRRSRDLQRVIGGHDEEQQGHRRTIPNDRGDEESIEEIRDTEEMQQRFLQRHSQDFAHLHSQALASMFQPSEPRSLTSAASVLTETSPTLLFDPRETEDERQRRIIEEARREGREKRRSWMLSKAGLMNGPMSPTTTFYGPAPTHSRNASSISSSILSPGASLASPRLGEMTPRAHQRQTSLRGGIRPLSLVISQENARARESAGSIVLGPPLVTSPVSVVLEEEEKSDVVGEMTRSESTSTSFSMSAGHENEPYISHAKHWSGHHRGSIHSSGSGSQGSLSRSVSIKSHRRTMSPAQQALPPHLRSFSASSVTMTNSSMSSLGAVIGGGSESSCSSGEHIGGPRVLSSDAFNFRMSVNAPAPRAESRMTNSTYAMGSFRTESRLTMRGPTPDGEQAEDRESRIQRRRARAFLVAGLKLESKAASASSQVVAEQDETDEWPMSPSEGKKDRRAGVVVENKLDLDNMEVMSASAPVERKRYSVMRREKQDDVPTLRRAGTPLFPFYSKPSEAQSEDSVSPDVLPPKGSPEITISVVEESGNIRPIPLSHEPVHFPRDESENSLQDPSAWRAQSGEMIRELFWLPSTQGDVTDVPTTPTRPISRPPSPAVIHSDSAGASPGRERKTSWSNAARGWLRSESKTDPEAQVEKGFGPGRGGDLSNTLTSTRDDRPSTPAPEKKSWKRYLGGAKTKRRGSLPEAFRQDLLTPTLQAPPAAHVRRSTEPSSPAYCVAGSPPAFPSLNNRQLDSSPLSAASFSPQTPECLTRSPGMRIVLSSQTPRAQGMEQGDILLPTPGMSHGKMSRHQQQSEGAGGSPSRMDMTGELYGLGLGPVQAGSPWKGKGKATSMAEEETWQRNFAEQAVALVQMSNQAAAGSSKKAFGLGRRPDVGIHAKSTAAPFGDYLQPPPSATLRPSSPAYSNSSESETEHDQLKTRTRQAGCAVDVDNLPAYHDRSIVLKHERRILPAKLFFMLGFLLGPWVWLFGGWALSPAGQYLPSTHIPLGLGHRRDSRFSPQSPPEYKQRGIRAALPPMNRDRPEKWVKRNRLAAVASSAVFIPAMCVGFGYLGKLL